MLGILIQCIASLDRHLAEGFGRIAAAGGAQDEDGEVLVLGMDVADPVMLSPGARSVPDERSD
jgi:hypothetical protein